MRHGDREDDDGIGLLGLDQALEVAFPARRHPAGDRLARQLVECRLLGARLGTTEVAIALDPRERVADGLVGLALAIRRVRRGSPPRRLDRTAAIRRDDEVDAGLVHPFPELPPGRRAPVPKVEIDGGRGREDLRSAHQYAPRRVITAGIVLTMIEMSSQIDQFSRYVKSRRTRSSKESPERPEICQRPVIPGRTL